MGELGGEVTGAFCAMSDVPPREMGCEVALRRATARLVASGVRDAALDAVRLFEAATGLTRMDVLRAPELPVSFSQLKLLDNLLDRRANREPVSRILGWREFYGRRFGISPAVLDPRPDTETLIDVALELIRAGRCTSTPRIIDFGTGSGAIILTLLAELPGATGVGTDISPDALECAARNGWALGRDVSSRVDWRQSDGVSEITGCFDLLISNPPYIPTSDICSLERDVRSFDPHVALDGGSDGLEFYRHIAANSLRLVPEGFVIVEAGAGQAGNALAIFNGIIRSNRLEAAWTVEDLLGHERCVALQTRRV